MKDTLSRIACNLNPMPPPLEWKSFRSRGVYSSSLDMNLDSRCTIVILWNSSWIWKTNHETNFKASNITNINTVLMTFFKSKKQPTKDNHFYTILQPPCLSIVYLLSQTLQHIKWVIWKKFFFYLGLWYAY